MTGPTQSAGVVDQNAIQQQLEQQHKRLQEQFQAQQEAMMKQFAEQLRLSRQKKEPLEEKKPEPAPTAFSSGIRRSSRPAFSSSAGLAFVVSLERQYPQKPR